MKIKKNYKSVIIKTKKMSFKNIVFKKWKSNCYVLIIVLFYWIYIVYINIKYI